MNPLLPVAVLRADGLFLMLVGGVAMLTDAAGHFLGAGPVALMHHSPYSIGSFEAHGLAALMGVLLWRAARAPGASWHGLGLAVHVLLGGSNLLFWPSFAYLDAVPMGIVTTAFHGMFVVAQVGCLRSASRLRHA